MVTFAEHDAFVSSFEQMFYPRGRTNNPGGRPRLYPRELAAERTCYRNMIARCTDPQHPRYASYGGRGIEICQRWLDPVRGFDNFVQDLGPRPAGRFSIERRNNDRGYCPENCSWRPLAEQQDNTRRSVWVDHDGVPRSLKSLAMELGITYACCYERYRRGLYTRVAAPE